MTVPRPKFDTLGIFFAEAATNHFFWDHHQTRQTVGTARLEQVLDYLANTMHFNVITYSSDNGYRNLDLVAKYFPTIQIGVTGEYPQMTPPKLPDVPARVIYLVDEPELRPFDPEILNDHVTRWQAQGHSVTINFCGLRRLRNDIAYAKAYLDRYQVDCASIDLYPAYYDGTDWEFALGYLREIRPYVKGRFAAIIQGFGKPGVWRYPTIEEICRLAQACKDAGADELHFFLWNSIWTGDELLTGLDVLPREYHATIAEFR